MGSRYWLSQKKQIQRYREYASLALMRSPSIQARRAPTKSLSLQQYKKTKISQARGCTHHKVSKRHHLGASFMAPETSTESTVVYSCPNSVKENRGSSQLPLHPESSLPASPTPRDKVADLSLVMLLDCINDATIWLSILRAGLSISQASFAHCYDWSHLVEVGVLQAGALSCKRWENLQDIRSTDAK